MKKKLTLLTAAALFLFGAGCSASGSKTENSAQGSGTALLKDSTLWRPRENLILYLDNESGKPFHLNLSVRDLNIYTYYPSRTLVQVIAPDDAVILRKWIEDDGITGGNNGKNFKYQDGIYDPFADYQYRQYHHFNSPGGVPPEKERSPFLANPEKLPKRDFRIAVPAAGKGIYRVFITGTWDQFLGISTAPEMAAGIHPGTGPLALVGNTLQKSWFYYPADAQDLCIAVTEETAPYTIGITLKDDTGKIIQKAKASGFCTFMMPKITKKNAAYELILDGIRPGACLTIRGVPQILFPDKAGAEKFKSALVRNKTGKAYHNRSAAILSDWAHSLRPQELDPGVKLTPEQEKSPFEGKVTYRHILDALAAQNIDPASPEYGRITDRVPLKNVYMLHFDLLVKALTDRKDGKNPFYGNPAILKRIYLMEFFSNATMTPGLRFLQDTPDELIFRRPAKVETFWDVATRSNWYALGGGGKRGGKIREVEPFALRFLPGEVVNAEKQIYRLWAAGRFNMHAAEVANQWGYNINSLIGIQKLLGDEDLKLEMARQQEMIMTPGYMGRQNPDITPFDKKHGKPDADVGISNAGYITEHWGFDGEYGGQQETLWGNMCQFFPSDKTIAWFNQIVPLKSHMMVPRYPGAKGIFNQFCSPTDYNTRTRGMAHKLGVSADFLGKVKYLDLWRTKKGEKPVSVWPALQKGDFVHGFGDKFYFVKQGDFYTILFSGPRQPGWTGWSIPEFHGDSLSFRGIRGMGYGGWGHENKPGLISGIHLAGSGAVWMGSNNSVMDSNTVWGHTVKDIYKVTSPNMERDVFAACYGPSKADFDTKKLIYRIEEKIPYVPLTVNSELRFGKSRIKARVTVSASKAFRAKDMHYSIPYVSDRYKAFAGLDSKETEIRAEKPLVTKHFHGTTPEQQNARLSGRTFQADTLKLRDPAGKGILIRFDSAKKFHLLAPLRYRDAAPALGSFVMELPANWKQGQKRTFEYEINPL